MSHPLDDEDCVIQLVITHVPTNTISADSVVIMADDETTLSEAINRLGNDVADDLLSKIEQRGG